MKPSDFIITLAGLPQRHNALSRDGWLYADEVRGNLKLFGFDVKAQQVAAWLGRLSREDAPRFERRDRWGDLEYRVTRFGFNDIENQLPKLKVWR